MKGKIEIDQTDIYGQTALFYAVAEGNFQMVKELLSLGANVNHVDSLEKETPIFYAVKENNLLMCKLLVENNAEIQIINKRKKNPIATAEFLNLKDISAFLQQKRKDK